MVWLNNNFLTQIKRGWGEVNIYKSMKFFDLDALPDLAQQFLQSHNVADLADINVTYCNESCVCPVTDDD